MPRGVVAAGHPVTAEAGAELLRAGGNAVDAALAAMFASFVAEPLLTGLGAGGYMLVAPPGEEPVLLDFFVAAAGRGRARRRAARAAGDDRGRLRRRRPALPHRRLRRGPVRHRGRGLRRGRALRAAAARGARRARRRARPRGRRGQPRSRPTCSRSSRRSARRRRPRGSSTCPRAGRPSSATCTATPTLAGALERLAAEGAAPFYTGEVAAAVCAHVAERGGLLTPADLAAYEAVPRTPVRVSYRGRTVLTNPPPSAGGTLIAHALAQLEQAPSPPSVPRHPRRDGGGPGPAHARVPLPARLDDAHLRDGRRRLGLRGDVHERRGLRRGGARHRRPPQQHDGRGGPLARTASSPTRPGAGCPR